MPDTTSATVHLLAGLNGAGKTTLARRLERELPAVRFTLDEWMLRLYELRYDDPRYAELSEVCQGLIWDTAVQALSAGTDVVPGLKPVERGSARALACPGPGGWAPRRPAPRVSVARDGAAPVRGSRAGEQRVRPRP